MCLQQWEFVCNSGLVLFGSESYQNDGSNSCHSMNILSIEYSNEFHSCKRDVFESSWIQHAFYTQIVQVCARQWEHVCNSGRVLFGSESYKNDRFNSCHSMNILSTEYSHEFHSCKRDVFESSWIQHAFYTQSIQVCPQQWEHVCNSGRHCLQRVFLSWRTCGIWSDLVVPRTLTCQCSWSPCQCSCHQDRPDSRLSEHWHVDNEHWYVSVHWGQNTDRMCDSASSDTSATSATSARSANSASSAAAECARIAGLVCNSGCTMVIKCWSGQHKK